MSSLYGLEAGARMSLSRVTSASDLEKSFLNFLWKVTHCDSPCNNFTKLKLVHFSSSPSSTSAYGQNSDRRILNQLEVGITIVVVKSTLLTHDIAKTLVRCYILPLPHTSSKSRSIPASCGVLKRANNTETRTLITAWTWVYEYIID